MASNRVKCFFDVKIDDDDAGRIIVDLFNDVCPKTCENFRALCTGEMGESEKSGKPLHYKNVKFHRVIKGFMVQSGDFTNNNGSGGESIYGGKFEDENFDVKHDEKYMLSMANKGENTNGSQFFITTEVCPHLDGRHVAFGKVVKGFEVVNAIENLPVDNRSRPLAPAVIVNCGELRLQKSSSSKTKGEKKKKLVSESDSSNSEDEKRLKRKEKKAKKKKDKESEEEGQQSANEEQLHPFASVSKINPDEIPDVPKNRFLDRGGNYDPPVQRNNDLQEEEPSGRLRSKASVQIYTRSGRKVKGRGFLRYRTPSRSRSRSMTPPHWKQAQGRHMKMDQLQEYRKRIDKQAREFDRRHKRRKERLEQEESSNLLIKQLGRVHSAISSSVLQVNPMEKINENIEGDWRVSRKQTLKKLKDERKKEKKSKHKDSSRSDPSNGDLKKKKKKERRGELELDDSALDYEADDGSESVTTNGTNHNKNRDSDNRRARSSSRDRKRDRRRSRSNSRRRSRSRDKARNRRRSRSRSKDRSRGWKNDRRRRSRSRS